MNKRKELGQFFTDSVIAEFMANLAITPDTKTVLDPAVGEGIFIKECCKKNSDLKFSAFDIDADMIDKVEKLNIDADLYSEDYLVHFDQNKYDAIICNPPYNKFQQIPKRNEYIDLFKQHYGINIIGHSNLCVYFLIKSLNELSNIGKCVYILPYEFMNTGYGETIKEYILRRKSLKAIYKFNSKISLFSDVLTTSCIMVFENRTFNNIDFIEINSIDELKTERYKNIHTRQIETIAASEKWNKYFLDEISDKQTNLISFSNIAKVKRGIATGSNAYFTLSEADIKKHCLSEAVCVKCVSKSPDIKKLIFTDNYFYELCRDGKKMYLFDGSQAESTADFDYISYGESLKVHETFLNSHRDPWFLLEKKPAAPIWISVFSRNKIKVVRNETNCKNLTTFHSIYLDNCSTDFINIFFCYLLTPIGQEILYRNKREYGGGLDKFEPNDINNAKVLNLDILSDMDKEQVLSVYSKIKSDFSTDLIAELNNIFSKYLADNHNLIAIKEVVR